MARIIPNENTWIGFTPAAITDQKPTVAQVAAAVDLTGYCISLNASARGNTVPTPAFDSLFETSTAGTSAATFDADFYRDDAVGLTGDIAWKTLYRGARGTFIISRFGRPGTGSNMPIAGDIVEVWTVMVTSRTMANMSSNTVLTFTASCSVNIEPNEAYTVA
jgi:hypothetical protein